MNASDFARELGQIARQREVIKSSIVSEPMKAKLSADLDRQVKALEERYAASKTQPSAQGAGVGQAEEEPVRATTKAGR